MLIVVLGSSAKACVLAKELASNKNNIVFFTGKAESVNDIGISPFNITEIKEFIIVNEINLCIVVDDKLAECDWGNILSDTECCTLSMHENITKMCISHSAAKKFAYKNKIPTTKFAVFEKQQQALDYLQTSQYPIVIMPDTPNDTQVAYIAETRDKSKKRAELLFQTGNKRILTENFIQGTKYTKYIISDGFSTFDLFETVSYFDEIYTNNVALISKEAKTKIDSEIVPNFINALLEEGAEFQGIIGISCITDKDDAYFSSICSFPCLQDFEILTSTLDEDLAELLYACAQGTLGDNYDSIDFNEKYAISADLENETITTKANTFKKAQELLIIEGISSQIIEEAINHWTR